MILWEIKLITSDTHEVLFHQIGAKVILPPAHLYDEKPNSILYINTLDSSSAKMNIKEKISDQKIA